MYSYVYAFAVISYPSSMKEHHSSYIFGCIYVIATSNVILLYVESEKGG